MRPVKVPYNKKIRSGCPAASADKIIIVSGRLIGVAYRT
jgi:hypothetical protein